MISSVSLLDRDSSDPPFLQPDDARSKRLAVLLFEVARSLDHDLASALPRLEGDPKLAALRTLILEEGLGTAGGHDEAVALVHRMLDRFEMPPKARRGASSS